MLRNYTPSDHEIVFSFHERILREAGSFALGPWDDDLKNIEDVYIRPGGCFVLIEENGSIQAMGALKIASEYEAEIKRMRVETSLQRKGYGQQIFDYLLLHAKEHGIKRLFLDTTHHLTAAQRFYEKNGFAEYERKPLSSFTLILYEKFL